MAVRITGAGVALTVGIILVTGLIVGGFFWARSAGDQARRDEAVKIAQEQLEKDSGDVALNDGDKDSEKNSDKDQNSTDNQGTTDTEDTSGENIPTTGHEDTNKESVDELPQTGVGDFSAAAILALAAFSVAAYIQSRRQLQ